MVEVVLYLSTILASIGKAVVGVLQHPEVTKNRAVYVRVTATTLEKLSTTNKKALG